MVCFRVVFGVTPVGSAAKYGFCLRRVRRRVFHRRVNERMSSPTGGRTDVIDIEIGVIRPELRLHMPADEDVLPLVRQALRSLGETVDADLEALEDAELALTEACANAVEHAYGAEGGEIEVTLLPGEASLRIEVVDQGVGIPEDIRAGSGRTGYGIPMIESIATSFEFVAASGTDLRMEFPLGQSAAATVDGAAPGLDPAERILRRLVAVVAAQRDMSTERVMEGLLLAELVARNALRYLVGESVQVHIDWVDKGFELRVGPLEAGGADAVIGDSEVPVIGSVLERLADGVRTQYRDGVEFLTLRVDPRG
jgi:serine/threonine-protein kinase RsbW